jgi:hypothetical protein
MSRKCKWPRAKVWVEADDDLEAFQRCLMEMPWRRCRQCGRPLLGVGRFNAAVSDCLAYGLQHGVIVYSFALTSSPIVAGVRGLATMWVGEVDRHVWAYHAPEIERRLLEALGWGQQVDITLRDNRRTRRWVRRYGPRELHH